MVGSGCDVYAVANCHPRENGDPVIDFPLRGNDKKVRGKNNDSLDSSSSLCHPGENGDPVLDSRMRGNDNKVRRNDNKGQACATR